MVDSWLNKENRLDTSERKLTIGLHPRSYLLNHTSSPPYHSQCVIKLKSTQSDISCSVVVHFPVPTATTAVNMYTIKPHCYYNTKGSRCITTTRAVVTPPSSVKIPRIAAEDPELQSTWTHRAWLTAGSTSVAVSLGKAVIGTADSGNFIQPVVAAAVGYILADLGSGLYHWGIDNYGDASTPMFGSQINAFRGHHRLVSYINQFR